MHEITKWSELFEWLSTRKRVGFIGSSDAEMLQCDVLYMELYQKLDGGFSISISLDSGGSQFVCDFESVRT